MSDGYYGLTCGECKHMDEKYRCKLFGDLPVTSWDPACMSFESKHPDPRAEFIKECLAEYDASVEKHPMLAEFVTPFSDDSLEKELHKIRSANDYYVGRNSAIEILKEEVFEAFYAWQVEHNKAHARQEFAQCVAVIMRCVKMMEESK